MKIPAGLKGKELTKFLIENKSAIIAEKKSMPMKFSDPVFSASVVYYLSAKTGNIKTKDDDNTEDPLDTDKLHVKVVANTFNFMDSQYDVLIPGCCNRTLKDNQKRLKFLHDHIYKLDAKVGEVTSAYIETMKLADLGLDQKGSTDCLIFEADIMKSYNQEIFNQYKANKIDQHSIGLQYVAIDIAINDEESPKEIEFWNKYIDTVINKDDAIAAGFFFVVSEIKLLENSCVLFGANSLTPTLDVESAGKSGTKTIATYDDEDDADDLMYCDKMMRKHTKMIKGASEYTGDNTEVKQAITNMTYNSTNSLNNLQQIKDKMLGAEKSIVIDPLKDIHDHPQIISAKAIQETKFINLN